MKTIDVLELTGKLLERYEAVHPRVDAYYGLLAYYALSQAAVDSGNQEYLDKCVHYLSQYPDNFDHPHYTFKAYRAGGNGRAFLLYKGILPAAADSIREYAELTMQAPAADNGILCWHNDPYKRRIWIDVITCVTPFMLYAGLALNEEKYIDFAADQCFKMYELLLDETCGLLHQSKGFMPDPRRISSDHWSRGNGWALLGLADLVSYLPKDSVHRAKAEAYLTDTIDALLPYQTARGLWRQEIIEPLAWEESSGTGLILYGLGAAIRTGLLDGEKYTEAFRKGIEGLAAYCIADDFSTYRSCPGCLCPEYPGAAKGSVEAYVAGKLPEKDEVHSYGCMMLAFVEARRNSITEVEIKGLTK